MAFIPFVAFNDSVIDDDEIGTQFVLSYLGLVGGLLLVVALAASFLAIDKIGVALAQGVFGGVAILVSNVCTTSYCMSEVLVTDTFLLTGLIHLGSGCISR
jgi:hypothetical protein